MISRVWRAAAIASLLSLALPSWPRHASAELSEAALTSLEYAADVERLRGLKLARVPETVSRPWAALQAEARRVALPLDPRPALEADLALYQVLGLLPPGEAGLREVREAGWPVIKAAHFPAEGGGQLVVAAGAGEPAHVMAVALAALDQSFGLGALAAESNRDRQLAVESLALGDAALVWLSRSAAARDGPDLAARLESCRARLSKALGLRPDDGTGDIADRLIAARFVTGLAAAMAIRDRSPWGVVDELYRGGLPRSTAQVLHPEAMVQDRRPRELRAAPIEALAGYGAPAEGVLGELRLRLWLDTWLDGEVASRAAAGWAGDVYHLYPPPRDRDAGAGGEASPALVALVAWDDAGEPAADEATDFAAAVSQAIQKRARVEPRAAGGGAETWVDARGLAAAIERRDDAVLVVLGCPADVVDRVRDEAWSRWSVGRVDLSALVDEDAPPPLRVEPPPPPPWHMQTPGYVAAILWLGVVLPVIAFVVARRTSSNPAAIYLYGLAATIALIVVGWFLGVL